MALLLFDIDGTLMKPLGVGHRAFDAALLALYGRLPTGQPFPFDGMLDPQIARKTLLQMGIDPTPSEVSRLLVAYVQKLPDEAPVETSSYRCLGFPAALERASGEGHHLGLLTGNVREGARIKLDFVGLAAYFLAASGEPDLLGAFGEDAAEREDLVPVALERCSKAYGLAFESAAVWLVGDSVRDVEAAKRAGVKSVAVATGSTGSKSLAAAGPDLLLPDLTDPSPLLDVLRRAGQP